MNLDSTGQTQSTCSKHILATDISLNQLFQNIKCGDDTMEKETKNNIKIILLLLVVFIILYALHITFGDRFEDQYQSSNHIEDVSIIFQTDYENKILTVENIYPEDINYYWSEVEIINGSATFDQYGIIKIGHTLSNCTGFLELEWKTTGIKILERDFR